MSNALDRAEELRIVAKWVSQAASTQPANFAIAKAEAEQLLKGRPRPPVVVAAVSPLAAVALARLTRAATDAVSGFPFWSLLAPEQQRALILQLASWAYSTVCARWDLRLPDGEGYSLQAALPVPLSEFDTSRFVSITPDEVRPVFRKYFGRNIGALAGNEAWSVAGLSRGAPHLVRLAENCGGAMEDGPVAVVFDRPCEVAQGESKQGSLLVLSYRDGFQLVLHSDFPEVARDEVSGAIIPWDIWQE